MACTLRDFFWIVLLPLSWVYSGVARFILYFKTSHQSFGIPVISVGNLSWGGTGKTPIVLEIAHRYRKYNPAILSRGYKSEASRRGVQIDKSQRNGPWIFGDEPWMLAQLTGSEVYVGAKRSSLFTKFRISEKHQLAILDDGYQHTQVARDINILVLSAEEKPGDRSLIPLGNLREPFTAMKRADLIAITTARATVSGVKEWESIAQQVAPETPVFSVPRIFEGAMSADGNLVAKETHVWGAFCGIGNPQRFQEDLKAWCPPQYFKSFSDHYHYTKKDIERLVEEARPWGVTGFLTTAKDFFKVAAFFEEIGFPVLMARSHYQIPEGFWQRIERGASLSC